MTSQGVALSVGNRGMSRVFSGTENDNAWNTVVSANSSVNLGLEMPNVTIDSVQASYTAGGMLYRIKDTKTNRISRYGFGNKLGYTCAKTSMIMPVQIKSSDILQVWPIVVNTTDHKTNVLALLYTSAGVEPFGALTVADNTDTALTSLESSQSLGDWAFNSTLKKVCIQLQDGATLNSVSIIDQTGGTIMTQYGGIRQAVGENSGLFNIEFSCAVPIMKGYQIKVNVQDN